MIIYYNSEVRAERRWLKCSNERVAPSLKFYDSAEIIVWGLLIKVNQFTSRKRRLQWRTARVRGWPCPNIFILG